MRLPKSASLAKRLYWFCCLPAFWGVFVALAVPGLGVLLVLFWLLLPAPFIWLHRRAIDGGGPELARFLQLWVSSTKWVGLVYGLSWLMYGVLCFAGALKWPEEKSTFLICGAVMAVFIGRHLWQTRALLRTRPFFVGIKMIADTPGQPLWSTVRLLAAELGTDLPPPAVRSILLQIQALTAAWPSWFILGPIFRLKFRPDSVLPSELSHDQSQHPGGQDAPLALS